MYCICTLLTAWTLHCLALHWGVFGNDHMAFRGRRNLIWKWFQIPRNSELFNTTTFHVICFFVPQLQKSIKVKKLWQYRSNILIVVLLLTIANQRFHHTFYEIVDFKAVLKQVLKTVPSILFPPLLKSFNCFSDALTAKYYVVFAPIKNMNMNVYQWNKWICITQTFIYIYIK